MTTMSEEQIEEAERILGYYDAHGMNWHTEADVIALLRGLLPEWSAFRTPDPAARVFQPVTPDAVRAATLRAIRAEFGDAAAEEAERRPLATLGHGDAAPGHVLHRYTDCPALTAGDGYHLTDDDDRPVTCPACRDALGLPPVPPFEDDRDGDNWRPADAVDGDEADCRRCGRRIVWGFDVEDPFGTGDAVPSAVHGWWYGPDGASSCTPGVNDENRYHAPTFTPPPGKRDGHVHFYWSEDVPETGAWSVYREVWPYEDAPEPIDGSQEWVSRHPDEETARAEAFRLQREGD